MLIYDVLHKEKVYEIAISDLRNFGVKYRVKKNAVKPEKHDTNTHSLRRVFKTPLSRLPLDVVSLPSGAIVHVPVFVSQACAALTQCITQEGLFRKAGSHIRQKELMARLDNGGALGEKHQAVDIANALKTFFRDLPESLIPHSYHDLFLRCALLKTRRVEALLLACLLLPPHHLNTLAFFMSFLKEVSKWERQNKMGIDNLAKVVGPNVMPLHETTMSAVQSRLETHLIIVRILIENAEQIGVLPEHIAEALSVEVTGSTENELDRSDPLSRSKYKKKKRRSGSLTRKPHLSASNLNLRMINGLKKMVGKSGSPEESATANNHMPNTDFNPVNTPSIKTGKKRKVTESSGPLSIKKKRQVLHAMPEGACLRPRNLFSSPVSSDPNPLKDKSPLQKSRVRKYLGHKIHSETSVVDKLDKPKKIRLSLDRLVSKSKQKHADPNTEYCKAVESPRIERRWSSVSSSSWSKKKRRTRSDGPPHLPSPLKEEESTASALGREYDRLFMDAAVNLSDDNNGEQASQESMQMDNRVKVKALRISLTGRSLEANFKQKSTGEYDADCSLEPQKISNIRSPEEEYSDNSQTSVSDYELTTRADRSSRKNDLSAKYSRNAGDEDEEFVRIPKSEYEEFKSRMSAIETRISQEFGCISKNSSGSSAESSASRVQSEYEKTLGEASIGSTATADHLAKRLGKELKIRKSAENKVIRSPSARKIGNLRRRSQEKPNSRRVSRNASWHISQRPDLQHLLQPNERPNNYCPKSNLKRGRPNTVYSGLSQPESHQTPQSPSMCSAETNARLDFLQKRLLALISDTEEHTGCPQSDDDAFAMDVDTMDVPRNVVRRASSFHGAEFIDNSRHFNQKMKELKKTNSQQNVTLNLNASTGSATPQELHSEKSIKWKDASGYFKTDTRLRTPAQQTGRASVAKLRAQNAGMVLAKAKLFDETTKTSSAKRVTPPEKLNQSQAKRKQSPRDSEASPGPKRLGTPRRKHSKSPKNNSAKLKLVQSPVIKMELTIVPQTLLEKRGNRRCSQKFERQNLDLVKNRVKTGENCMKQEAEKCQKENINIGAHPETLMVKESSINIFNLDSSATCKTPHIKRPMSLKTPKSARSLARKTGTESRRTPMKAVAPSGTPRRHSPRTVLKSRQLTRQTVCPESLSPQTTSTKNTSDVDNNNGASSERIDLKKFINTPQCTYFPKKKSGFDRNNSFRDKNSRLLPTFLAVYAGASP